GHGVGADELSVARALTAPGGEERAARVELLYVGPPHSGRRRERPVALVGKVVLVVRDVDVLAPVGCHGAGLSRRSPEPQAVRKPPLASNFWMLLVTGTPT